MAIPVGMPAAAVETPAAIAMEKAEAIATALGAQAAAALAAATVAVGTQAALVAVRVAMAGTAALAAVQGTAVAALVAATAGMTAVVETVEAVEIAGVEPVAETMVGITVETTTAETTAVMAGSKA